MNKLIDTIKNIFTYKPDNTHHFNISSEAENLQSTPSTKSVSENFDKPKNIFPIFLKNKNYLKNQYNTAICTDVIVRDFFIIANNVRHDAFIIYIDGMVDTKTINNFVISPLMVRNIANAFDEKKYNSKNSGATTPTEKVSKNIDAANPIENFSKNDGAINHTEKFSKNNNSDANYEISKMSLSDFIFNTLIPHSDVKKTNEFKVILSSINMGNCILFVDGLDIAFNIDVKGFKQRSIDTPNNEIVVRGSQECFVENIRTNTSILRRLINSEKLTLESLNVGKLTNTSVVIGYIDGLTNMDLVSEVRYRIKNLDIDYLTSSGQLEQLIQDSPDSIFPQILATERPDKIVNHLLDGRVCVLVNGSPYALVLPGIFSDFLSSPEDLNLKYQYANLSKIVRFISIFISILLPGLYIAITNYHQDLLPTELLFTISSSRESVPFPTVVEILLMEISFELIREAGLRVPTSLGTTIGIVGALILGEAAVSASLVSPILIIVVAITGICSFSIPDFSLNYTFRICRFIYIILGYLAGFLGLSVGIFIQLALMCNLKSFGVPYLDPSLINKKSISNYFVLPVWKRERISKFVKPQEKYVQGKISMKWRNE